MPDAFICDAIRTPIGRYGTAARAIRAGDTGLMIAGGVESMT